MKRKQIYLDEDSEQRLKTEAMRRGRSEASLIREAVRRFLAEEERALPNHAENPLLGMIGIVRKGRPDAAVNHDRYLYRGDE